MDNRPRFGTYNATEKDRYWCARWYDAQGKRRRKNFGNVKEMTRKMAEARFDDWIANEYRAKDYVRNPSGNRASYLVRHLAKDTKEAAKGRFLKRGKWTGTVYETIVAMDALESMYGDRPADSIGAPEIAKVRDAMVFSENNQGEKITLTRKTVNGRIRLIKDAFREAREQGNVSQATALDVASVAVLKKGRSSAKDSKAVKPVAADIALATAEKASSVVKAMIEVQLLTGMRPGELCAMKGCDIDRSKPIWLYAVPDDVYKLAHMENVAPRIVPLGPRSQEILRPFLEDRDEDKHIFSARESVAEHLKRRRENRRTPLKSQKGKVWQSHAAKRSGTLSTKTRDHFDCFSYRRAVRYACVKAKVPFWHPNQIRHTRGTEIRAIYGLEAASVTLGHTNIRTTEIYAERNLKEAIKIAKKAG